MDTPPPIILMSFNRPDYLERVLVSLKNQHDVTLDAHPIYLFQDGAVNPYSGKLHAADEDIARNIALFETHFPKGTVRPSPDNLGVALNFERAEQEAFEILGARYALFLEDDLELGPFYIKTMLRLAELVLQRSDIGYFAAYGQHRATLAHQAARADQIIALNHNWGFGLTQEQWRRSAPYVEQYLELVRGIDYRDRPNETIFKLTQSWGCGAPGSSQDVIKSIACHLTGGCKINTTPAFAQYIGETGLHSTPELFTRMGFGKTQVMTQDIFTKERLTDEDIAHARTALKKYAEFVLPMARPDAKMSPAHKSDLEKRLIGTLFEVFLERPADPSGIETYRSAFRTHDFPRAAEIIARGLMNSREFRNLVHKKNP
ncbi:hypothetical protein PX554_20360 [Sphingomonas sp. H39-1-10]|uniref:hypothetical protein n=1 Tax=Sphingomonas pollutisoli TaxID=3030829 RepID=UPI0023B9C480|nr:hypothetical protein [Sphingomonas pollutisoli]MDF0490488.1 hypothetical protein [Sphingomonas pollutisoli]